MPGYGEIQRRAIIPLVGLAVAGCYLAIYQPFARRAAALDTPVHKAWTRLATSLDQSNTVSIDFVHITNQLNDTRQALATLDSARQKAAVLLALPSAVRTRMNAPFQLVDYENERSKKLEAIGALANQRQTTLDPGVLAGFPEHTTDVKQPALLWFALALTESLLTTALQSGISSIHSLELPLPPTNSVSAGLQPGDPKLFGLQEFSNVRFFDPQGSLAQTSTSNSLAPATVAPPSDAFRPVGPRTQLIGIALQIEMTGPADHMLKIFQTISSRTDDSDKLPLFIDRLVIKKQSPDKPDEVRVWMRVVGFVLGE
jgi:hypothetical protein